MVGEGSTHVKPLAVRGSRFIDITSIPKLIYTSSPLTTTSHVPTSKQPLNPEDYIAIGLAKCFKLNDGGKLDGACVEPSTYYTHMHRVVAPRLIPFVLSILASHHPQTCPSPTRTQHSLIKYHTTSISPPRRVHHGAADGGHAGVPGAGRPDLLQARPCPDLRGLVPW